MTDRPGERLYQLLPALHRRRDLEAGEPLRALLAVMQQELEALEQDISGLYDNWFIETCEDWVAPYIGDLLGVEALYPGVPGVFSLRAYIANTITYRRRKGTSLVLEQIARDVSGWPARVVEYAQRLSAMQHLNHLRPDLFRTHPVQQRAQFDLLGSPFGDLPHTVDVRRIASARGRYNVPNVGIHVCRGGVLRGTRGGAARVLYIPSAGLSAEAIHPPPARE